MSICPSANIPSALYLICLALTAWQVANAQLTILQASATITPHLQRTRTGIKIPVTILYIGAPTGRARRARPAFWFVRHTAFFARFGSIPQLFLDSRNPHLPQRAQPTIHLLPQSPYCKSGSIPLRPVHPLHQSTRSPALPIRFAHTDPFRQRLHRSPT